ncbi:MAG: hypothetical protein RL698_601 [Pseudomonadota bacterium]|jgi:hypothetical protein
MQISSTKPERRLRNPLVLRRGTVLAGAMRSLLEAHPFGRRLRAGLLLTACAALAACGSDSAPAPTLIADAEFKTISPVGPIEYEGRNLQPQCMDGSPYHFFVKRGSVNKVLMYYQGGGACWDEQTCSLATCDTNVNPDGGDNPNNQKTGFGDRDNPDNPFHDWSIVFVSYCSCDIHFGDAAQDYPKHVEHRGFDNAKVAEKWARENLPYPDEVFVTGSSAGAYGAFFHGPLLIRVWPKARFNVLADAGNGVITQQFLDGSFPNWNFEANLPGDIPGLKEILRDGSGIPGYTKLVANEFPKAHWAHYSTAFDGGSGGQTGFYNLMLQQNLLGAVNWWEGSCAFTRQMTYQAHETAAAVPANYRYYIGTGSRHTMFGSNKVYDDTTGGVPTIVDWVNAMRAGSQEWKNVECEDCGLLLDDDVRPKPLRPPFQPVGDEVVVTCTP